MSEAAKGILAMAGACTVWGLSGLFFKALAGVPPLEVLAHRIVWSAIFFGLLLALQGRIGEAALLLRNPRLWSVLCAAALLISANWFGFIHAVQAGHALEASLGYYIFPLFAVMLGYLVLGERFSRLQSVAIGFAVLAVAVLTLGLGVAPWIALLLAGSFSGYGFLKKRLGLGPVVSVSVEALLLTPLSLVWLAGLHSGLWSDPSGRPAGFFGSDTRMTVLLLLSGPLMTGLPLILFSYAARRVEFATLGFVQYLNPTLQFAIAVAVFGETFTRWHALAFPMIWTGLTLYSWEGWRGIKASRSRAISAGTAS